MKHPAPDSRKVADSRLTSFSNQNNETADRLDHTQRSCSNYLLYPLWKTENEEQFKENINSITHALGIAFGLAAVPILVLIAWRNSATPLVAGACIYGISFLMVFTFSTIYHGLQKPGLKRIFEKLDHISIYYLIAGTYTPLILAYMNNAEGKNMLYILWGLALLGTFFKSCFGCRFNTVSTIVYLLMGWLMVWTGGSFFSAMPGTVMTLVIGGGIVYTLGVTFYLWEKWKWHHATWHLLALSGAICHYAAVLLSVGGL